MRIIWGIKDEKPFIIVAIGQHDRELLEKGRFMVQDVTPPAMPADPDNPGLDLGIVFEEGDRCLARIVDSPAQILDYRQIHWADVDEVSS